jgi:type 1 glutamine amidotransferase
LRWIWGVSHHPPLGPVAARPTDKHAIVGGVPAFNVIDEVYTELETQAWMTPFLEARADGTAEWRPVGLAGEHSGARRAWCGLGHDAASLGQPENRRIIQRAARWVAREM